MKWTGTVQYVNLLIKPSLTSIKPIASTDRNSWATIPWTMASVLCFFLFALCLCFGCITAAGVIRIPSQCPKPVKTYYGVHTYCHFLGHWEINRREKGLFYGKIVDLVLVSNQTTSLKVKPNSGMEFLVKMKNSKDKRTVFSQSNNIR